MIAKKTIDHKTMEEKHSLVKVNTIKHKETREIGTEWICANTWHLLKLTQLFENLGWSEEKVQLSITQVIRRAVYPGSELATGKWIKEDLAVCYIASNDVNKRNKLLGCN